MFRAMGDDCADARSLEERLALLRDKAGYLLIIVDLAPVVRQERANHGNSIVEVGTV
jgi:hypothetical protein